MNKKLVILSLLIIILMSVQFVSASDDVDNNVLSDNGENQILNSPTETKTYADLKDLIDAAEDGAEIPLEYNYDYNNGYGSLDPQTGINITKSLTIIGNGATIDGKSASALFNISEGVTVTLKNLTIKNSAKFVGGNLQQCYRAITVNGNLNIVNCTFDSNIAGDEWSYNDFEYDGSVIYQTNGNLNIQDSNFINNVVHTNGIIFSTGTVRLNNSYFYNNRAINREDSSGGVIFANFVDVIENCTFKRNVATAGGSIMIFNGNTQIINSTFDGTDSARSSANAAAIMTWGTIDLIENTTFTNFTSTGDAGAILIMGGGNTKIKNSTFKNNKGANGGAIYTYGNVEIENADIESNSGTNGGFLYTEGSVELYNTNSIRNNGKQTYPPTQKGGFIYAKGDVNIRNTTFGANFADVAGGAIYTERNVKFYNSSVNGSEATWDSGDGGFIYAWGNVDVENSTIANINMKIGDSKQYSGAIYARNLIVKNSTFTHINKDEHSEGGAIRVLGNAEIYNSNFTHNRAINYGAGIVNGKLYIYDCNFINNTHGTIFAGKDAVVNNTWFVNNSADKNINGRAIGSNATLNITNSHVIGTTGTGQFNGTIFSNLNLYIENCTIFNNYAYAAKPRGMAICTNSNITIINCDLDDNTFTGNDVYGGAIYAVNAYVVKCNFTNSSLMDQSGNSHGVAIFAENNITVYNCIFENLQSWNSEHGAISGKYVSVHNSNFTNIFGFCAFGAAIHADVANVTNSSFHLINSSDNKDNGGAIYANYTYAYGNNFTNCHAGRGGAIYSENYTVAIENIFIDNFVQYSGGAIATNNGFIEYNVFIGNGKTNQWGDLCDIAFFVTESELDSLELNWWGHNRPFEDYGVNRAKTNAKGDSGGVPYLPETWVIMKFFITDEEEPYVGQGVNLTTTLADYYNNTDGNEYDLAHNVAKRIVVYNATNETSGKVEGRFSHDMAPIINTDTVLYYNNDFVTHRVSSTIDYQTLYLTVRQFEINVTKTVSNSTPKFRDIINYTITVTTIDLTNYSDPDAQIIEHSNIYNVTITDILDSRLEFISSNDTNYNAATGEWFIENLVINSTYSLNIKVRVKGTGNITNFANITKINDTEVKNPHGVNVTIYVNESSFVELEVTKKANVTDSILVGDKIKFTITVNNTGNKNATDVVISDILPKEFKYESGGNYDATTRNVTWTISQIEAGKSVEVELFVSAVGVGNVSNIAYAYCEENKDVVNATSDNITINPDVRLNVTKAVEGGVSVVNVGDDIVYTITVTNEGKSNATDVSVVEHLSDLVVVVGAVGDGSWNNQTKVWSIPVVANGTSASLTLTVRVVANGTVTNAVVAKAKENTTEVTGNSTNVTANPDVRLNVTKVVEGGISEVNVGDDIVYTITVTNEGKSNATDVSVVEHLSDLVVVVGAVGDGSWNNQTKVWSIPVVANGTSASLRLTVRVVANGTVTNAVVATAKENTTEVTGNSTNVTANPDVRLNVTKVVEGGVSVVNVGDNIVYVITVTNEGKSNATDVSVVEHLSDLVVVVGAVGDGSWNNQTKVWSIPVVANGTSASLTLTVRVVANGTVTNAVVATAKENTTEVSGNSTNVTANPDVRLNVTKVVEGGVSVVNVGDNIVYVITVTNEGKSNATDVSVVEHLSDLVVVVGAVGDGSWNNQTKVWSIPVVANGTSASLTLTVRVVANGTVTNAVVATAKENTTEVTGNSTNVTANPDVRLNVTKVVEGGVSVVNVGDDIVYVITVTNEGKSNATDVSVVEHLSDLVVVVGAVGDGSWNNQTKVWSIPFIANGTSASLRLTVRVVANGTVTNAVIATAKENDTEVIANASDIPVGFDVKLNITKVVVGGISEVNVGDDIVYIVTVTNEGKSNATDVSVVEHLSDLVVVVGAVGDGSWNNQTKVWSIPVVANGTSASLTLTVRVVANGTVTNAVVATAKENTTEVSGNSTNVTANPDVRLNVTKVVEGGISEVNVGDDIVYTVTVTNEGKSNATDVSVVEHLSDLVVVVGAVGDGSWNNQTKVWSIPVVANGTSASLRLTVRVVANGTVTNAVVATAKENTTEVSGNSTNVTANPDVRLNVTKVVEGSASVVNVGDDIVYTVTVTNEGKSNATDVSVVEHLSDLVVVVGAVGDGSWNNQTKVWSIPVVANGTSSSLRLTVRVVANGTVTNAVVATAKENTTEVISNSTNVTANPDVRLNVTKVVEGSASVVNVGDNIVYTVTVTNEGKSNATDVSVVEHLSDLVVVVGAVGDGSWNNQTKVWSIPFIANGTSASLTLTVRVVANGTVTNAVIATAKENDTEVIANASDIPVGFDVKLNITKVVEGGISEVNVGDDIVYTITVTNEGKSNATDVSVVEHLSDLVVVVGAVGDGSWNNQTKVWSIPVVANGTSASLTLTVKVVANGTVTNAVVATAKENTTEVIGNSTNVTANLDVRLNITKVVEGGISEVNVGDNIVYTITVTNEGKSNATDVSVVEHLSDLVVVVGAVGDGIWNNQTKVWSIPVVANGTSSSLRLTVRVVANGTVTNAVVATAKENTTEVISNSTNVTANPDVRLNVTKVVEGSASVVNVGDNIVYTITVTNEGKSNATDVSVVEHLSDLVVVVSAVGDGSWNNQTKVWSIPFIANGTSASLRLTVRVVANGTVTNAVIATAKENTTEVIANASDIPVGFDVKLNITKVVVGGISEVNVGDNIVYIITVINEGKSNATDVSVVEHLSDLVVVVGAVGDGSWNNQTKVWSIPVVANGTSASLTLTVKVVANGTVTNAVVATAKENTTEVIGNSTNVTANLDVRLNVTKVVEGGISEVNVGDNIVYTITVTNEGKSNATDVSVVEHLSDLVVVVGAVGDGSWNNQTKVWSIPVVANGTSASLTLTVKVVANGTVTNAVVATAKENNTEVTGNSTNVTANPDVRLNVTKVVEGGVSVVNVGDNIVYTITVTNEGKSNATDVNVVEHLSDLVVVVGAVGDGSWNNQTKVWSIPVVANGTSTSLTLTVKVVANGTVTNAVVATAKENTTEVTGNSTNVTANLDVRLNVTKVVEGGVSVVNVGDNIVYTITVTNEGKSNATDVNVVEHLSDLVVVVGAAGDGIWNNQTKVWSIPVVANGTSSSLRLTVRVVANGTVTNAVIATAKENTTEVTGNSTNVTSNYDVKLIVTKVANVTNVSVLDNVKFTITVNNTGHSDAENVIVYDILDRAFGYVESDGYYNRTANKVIWNINQIKAGQSAKVYVIVSALRNGTFTNAAIVYCDGNKTESNATEKINVTSLVDVAIDLSVDNSTPNIYGEIIITLKVNNYGPSMATNVTGKLNHDFLTALKIISIDSEGIVFHEGLLGYALQNVLTVNEDGSFEIGHLDVNQEVSAKIKALVLREGKIIIDGSISSDEKDSNLSNNYDAITLNVQPVVDLSVNKTVNNANPRIGDIIEYTITVANAGPSNATVVKVLEKLPNGLKYVSDNGKGTYNHKSGVWTINSIKANETKSLCIKVQVTKTGKITNAVKVSSKEKNIDPYGGFDKTTINVKPKKVDLDVTIDANATKVNVDDFIELTITLVNKGNTDATGVKVKDVLPNGFKFISDDGDGAYNPKLGIWTIGNLNAGESKVLHILVQATKAGNFTYSAEVVANEVIVNESSAKDSITIEVVGHNNDSGDKNEINQQKVQLKATGNPLIVLVMSLLLAGVCVTRRKQ